MISRRNFIAITILMGVLVFLFQFLNVAKEKMNPYQQNVYAEEPSNLPEEREDDPAALCGTFAIIGDASGNPCAKMAEDWCRYRRKDLTVFPSMKEFEKAMQKEKAQMFDLVFVCPEAVDWKEEQNTIFLQAYVKKGSTLIFSELPELSIIQKSGELRDLLGIRKIREENTTVQGIHLFEGFLLGGETIFTCKTQEDEEKKDLEFTFPWLQLDSGVKTYLVGMPEDDTIKAQDNPPLLWRRSYGEGFVFAVNGDYLQDGAGLGILSAMEYESRSYLLYPVVNGQNLVVADYPSLAEENEEMIQKVYSTSLRGVNRDLLWPSLISVYRENSLGLSCMLAPQLDYGDDSFPISKDLTEYAKLIREENGELGLSAYSVSDQSIESKLGEDKKVLQKSLPEYEMSSLYVGHLGEEKVETALKQPLCSKVRTVVEAETGGSDLIGFQNKSVTRQQAVVNGFEPMTFRTELRLKSSETALGYSSVLADMSRISYPQTEEDYWETVSRKFSANLKTYWKPFSGFEGTTVSECDSRIRNFLAAGYREERKEDTIRLKLSGTENSCWFLLRTHNENVETVRGGTAEEIEKDTWLIQAEESTVIIQLGPSDTRYYQ